MASPTRPRVARIPARPPAVQIELFPIPLSIEPLDPRQVGGADTRVMAVYLVRRQVGAAAHRVFHDRYGWYCEDHGPTCDVVLPLREALGLPEAVSGAVPEPDRVRPPRRR